MPSMSVWRGCIDCSFTGESYLHHVILFLFITSIIAAITQIPIPMAHLEIVPVRIEDASSAASTSTSCLYYDVFINHRGPDVKATFAGDLYRRLSELGLQVFFDKEELVEGHHISSQLEAAIKVAAVQVAIFSPTYAESYWCLNELVLMVKSEATILPVFYHVEPSVLRWTSGAYGEAMQNLQQKTTRDPQTGETKPRYDSDTIQNWRNALSHVAGISGFVLHGNEGELLEKVVQRVLKKVPKPLLDVAKYPTGLGEKLQDFERTVLSQQPELKALEAKVVGIVGVGGVGKTTLAKQFFNSKRSHYNASSFLFDVRENAQALSYLQSKLILDLRPDLKHKDIKIESRDQGIGILKKHLSSCHALIILDDIGSRDQMEAVLPIKDILSRDSLIVVTSRDKHVLRSSGILDSSIYNLKGLNTRDSKELFCSYAFYQRHPLPGFADLVDRFVMACDGLPLSLKVFGALVCGQKEMSYWEEILDRLPPEIQERLRISYESLDKEDQSIFIDIVCFSILGHGLDKAIRIWGMLGVKNLENKCLLEVDNENKIKVHNHVRDMARCIDKEGSMPRRFYWIDDFLEQPSSVITEVRGIKIIPSVERNEGIKWYLKNLRHSEMMVPSLVRNDGIMWYLKNLRHSEMMVPSSEHNDGIMWCVKDLCHSKMLWYKRWSHEVLENHKQKLFNNHRFHGTNLKIVITEDGYLKDILRRIRLPHLIWLCWIKCPYSALPSWVPMKNLRVLDVLGSRLKLLWQSEAQAPLNLRELNIIAPLSHFPNSIGKLKHLENIVVYPVGSSISLKTLPQEFCNLCSLKYLVLSSCSRMVSLPESLGKLTNLQHIELSRVSRLKSLPESFGMLINLQCVRCFQFGMASKFFCKFNKSGEHQFVWGFHFA